VRDAHRHGAESQCQRDVVLLDDVVDLTDEPLPLEVRLRTGHQEVRSAVEVVLQDDLEGGVVVVGVVVLAEGDHRTARAIVEHHVEVELVDDLTLTCAQLIGRQTGGRAGAQEAVERVDQQRTVALAGDLIVVASR
jgi:hypothetical protein